MKTATMLIGIASVVGMMTMAAPAYATVSQPGCVNGSERKNLTVTWNGNNSVSVTGKNGAPVCDDTNVYLTSYIMPDRYDGDGYNPTATPQLRFDSASGTLSKGETAPVTLTVKMPRPCRNVQVDLYYGPEVKVFTWKNRLYGRFISGKIVEKSEMACPAPAPKPTPTPQPAPQPGRGAMPAELPRTGSGIEATVASTSALASAVYAAAYAVIKRR